MDISGNPKNGVKQFLCIGCGKMVSARRQKGSTKYCSAECYHKNRPYKKPRSGVTKSCLFCGKTFYVSQNRSDAKFCSVDCHNSYQGRNKVRLICKTCGKEFMRSPSFSYEKYCSISCRNNDPGYISALIKISAAQSRKSPNKFESSAYLLMDEMGISYIPQYTIGGKFTVDAFVPSKNTVVQFDGDYWHGNPSKYKNPDNRQRKRMALDISQNAYCKACGYSVIRIWQSEFSDINSVKEKLSSLI